MEKKEMKVNQRKRMYGLGMEDMAVVLESFMKVSISRPFQSYSISIISFPISGPKDIIF